MAEECFVTMYAEKSILSYQFVIKFAVILIACQIWPNRNKKNINELGSLLCWKSICLARNSNPYSNSLDNERTI